MRHASRASATYLTFEARRRVLIPLPGVYPRYARKITIVASLETNFGYLTTYTGVNSRIIRIKRQVLKPEIVAQTFRD